MLIDNQNKKLVYLDYNIFKYIKDGKTNLQEIARLCNLELDDCIFPYAPPHCEDLFRSENVEKKATSEQVECDLKNIEKISNKYELIPIPTSIDVLASELINNCSNTIFFEFFCRVFCNALKDKQPFVSKTLKPRKESPHACYARVAKHRDDNDRVRNLEEAKNLEERNHRFKSEDDKQKILKQLNNIRDSIGSLQYIMDNYFCVFECLVEHFMDELDVARCDKKKKKDIKKSNVLNRTNDITHMIYGAYADYFITADEILFDKMSEFYENIGIKT